MSRVTSKDQNLELGFSESFTFPKNTKKSETALSAPPSSVTSPSVPAPEAPPREPVPQLNAITVSQLTQKVKGLLERDVGTVWVKGEISSYRPAASGHLYFNLKDAQATIACAMFRSGTGAGVRSGASASRFQVRDGLEVLIRGRISVYAPRGNYQLIVESIEPLGFGALQLAFEQLKEKLQKEGLFDPAKKRPIPPFPKRVALITSATGAALQDMLNVLGRRNAGISLLILPTLVQGDDAPPKILQAINIANKFNLGDVIIVARGGGSMEDLWAFNNESVVRAIAQSAIPVISAIGHEIDFTIADFVADLRAPTPSAAAELVSKNRADVLESLVTLQSRLRLSLLHRLSRLRQNVLTLEGRLVSPLQRLNRDRSRLEEYQLRLTHALVNRLAPERQKLDEAYTRMQRALEKRRHDRRATLQHLSASLEALSPLKVLSRGYTLVKDVQSQALVKSSKGLKDDQKLDLYFSDGRVPVVVQGRST